MTLEVCMVRTTTARTFGSSAIRVKNLFLWFQLGDFAIIYSIHTQGYCHLVVSTMAILSFETMCRYSDVNRLRWRNVHFDNDLNVLKLLSNEEIILNFVKVITRLP